MEELNGLRCGAAHDGVVDVLLRDDGAGGHHCRREALGRRDDVRGDAEVVHGKRSAEAAERGDDLVQDEQNAMVVADLAEPLQVALGGHEDPGRARHGLHDDRRDVGGAVQRDEVQELIGEVRAFLGLTDRERLLLDVEGALKVIHGGDERARELGPVAPDAADARAANVGAMVGLLAADKDRARPLPAAAVVRESHLERRVYAGAAAHGEKGLGVASGLEVALGNQCLGPLLRRFVAHHEARGVDHLIELLLHGLDHRPGRNARRAAPRVVRASATGCGFAARVRVRVRPAS
mmetsp:Transcript_8222/g.23399  ORF Transcript_8222/g.23399 Transcript_8222/m.23399 type:complete len:293 (-) Transcript_8222:291-1169(-)